MKKSLLSVLTLSAILAFGLNLFGCSNSTNTNTGTIEKVPGGNTQIPDSKRAYIATEQLGTFDKHIYTIEESYSVIYSYSSLKENVQKKFNEITEYSKFKGTYNNPTFEENKFYIELTLNFVENSDKLASVDLGFYDKSATAPNNVKNLNLSLEKLEALVSNVSIDADIMNKFESIGTISQKCLAPNATDRIMFKYSDLKEGFLNKFNDIEINGQNWKGDYIGFNHDKNFYWIEFIVENTSYEIRFINKNKPTNSEGEYAKTVSFYTKEDLNKFITINN